MTVIKIESYHVYIFITNFKCTEYILDHFENDDPPPSRPERSSRKCQGNGDDRKSPCSTREIPVPSRHDMMSPTSGRTTRRDRETPSRSISRDHELPGWSDTSPSRDGGNSGRSPIHLQRYETRSPIFENTPASRLPSPSDSVFSRPTRY